MHSVDGIAGAVDVARNPLSVKRQERRRVLITRETGCDALGAEPLVALDCGIEKSCGLSVR